MTLMAAAKSPTLEERSTMRVAHEAGFSLRDIRLVAGTTHERARGIMAGERAPRAIQP
jgi:hypothetical protein